MNNLLNAKEVAQILNVSLPYAYALMRKGNITTVRIGKAVRVRPEDLEEFILQQVSTYGSIYSPNEKSVSRGGI